MTSWTKRQFELIGKWINEFNCIGLMDCYTAFGKSSGIAIPAIKQVNPESLIIVVPSIKLKQDWEDKLIVNKLKGKVLVINTAIRNTYSCELLIIDEVHRVGAETFREVFNTINYSKLLCLTASPERQDGNESIIFDKAPLVDRVTLEEGLKEGWVDPFEVIKIPIELTEDEKIRLDSLNKMYDKITEELGAYNPMKQANFYISYLNINKWCIGKKTNKVYFKESIRKEIDFKGSEDEFKQLIDANFIKPTKEHNYYKKALLAKKFYNIVADRKKLLYNAKNKLSKTVELFEQYQDKYKFIFSQRIEFLEQLAKLLPSDEIELYHSKMKKKDKDNAFKRFNDGRTKVKTMLSVKSLVEGIDIPKLSVSIITSFTSSQIDRIQIWGRNIRKYKDKKAVIIYLYVPNSQEEQWLNKSMSNETRTFKKRSN